MQALPPAQLQSHCSFLEQVRKATIRILPQTGPRAIDLDDDPDDTVISPTPAPLSTPSAVNTINGDLDVEDPMVSTAITTSYSNGVKTFF
ncbi:hypothetical protein D8674_008978 [Pyrus ussuriensis x Pyrus communis]|uniref:Uncharacterized protein n=1 Tax=Pyrus ussuriensis x Pyrus communis TaxID=2448454 RepID=A0A5N5HUW7_9ROSA|nr:hypothetical protein D8674_008978 [Pyrus ussuriensis x Pyrus communis]